MRNKMVWGVYNYLTFFFCILMFWVSEPSSYPDYATYVEVAHGGYSFFTEWISEFLLTSNPLFDRPDGRVLFFTALVHVATLLFLVITSLCFAKYSFSLALYFSLYLPFFMTTAIRASLAYIIAGVLFTFLLNAGQKYRAFAAAVIASFFHDSAIFSVVVLLLSYLIAANISFVRFLLLAKAIAVVCLFVALNGVEFIFDNEWFGNLGRFFAYLDGGLNSKLKVIYLFLHVFLLLYLCNDEFINVNVIIKYFVVLGAVGVSIAAVFNQVVAIRLLGFVLAPGCLLVASRIDRSAGLASLYLAPFMLVVFLFNFWVLVQ